MHSGMGLLDAVAPPNAVAPPRTLDSKVPGGPIAEKWDRYRFESKLVKPATADVLPLLLDQEICWALVTPLISTMGDCSRTRPVIW